METTTQSRIFSCPSCRVDTPHTVRATRGNLYGLVCTQCSTASLVRSEELKLYQVKWEEELQQVLDHLRDGDDAPD